MPGIDALPPGRIPRRPIVITPFGAEARPSPHGADTVEHRPSIEPVPPSTDHPKSTDTPREPDHDHRDEQTEEIIGRDEINDLEAILSVVNTDEADGRHVVHSEYDTIFTWDYEKGQRPKLNKLYEKAKKAQWNGQTDLPWETDVDQEKLVASRPRPTVASEPGST